METVKVDIQKLQLLNDRINQTIEALSQLRQTVHAYTPPVGLQHSVANVPFAQGFGLGYGVNAPTMFSPVGLQHTVAPFATAQNFPLGYNIAPQGYPIAQSFMPTAPLGWWNPMGGLSHTSYVPRFEAARLDPNMAMWIAQQFPYAFSATPPVV